MSSLRARCPDCRTFTAVAIGSEYECHTCGRQFAAGLVRVPRAWGSGGEAMAEAAALALPYPEAAVIDEPSLEEQTRACEAVLPKRPVVLGGCCCAHVGAVRGLGRRFGRLGVVWLDAHGDLNTPESSASGNVHGMPVAHLLGHGDPRLAGISAPGPAVRAENVAIIGARDLDPAERAHAREWGIRIFTMRDLDERGLRAVMADAIAIASEGTVGFYLSCDADWVDPREAPGVGTAVRGGATFREAHLAMEMVADTRRMVGMDLVEVNPVLDDHNRTAELCVHLVTSAFGLRIM